jgi:hypothetical protein
MSRSGPDFETASNDPDRDSKEKATSKGFRMILTGTYFILNMDILLDALTEGEDISLELQKHSTSLMCAHKLLEIKYLEFE